MITKKHTKIRTSFTIQKSIWEGFCTLTSRLKMRRDNFLNTTLSNEVNELAQIRPNSLKAEEYLRESLDADSVRVNLLLDKKLLEYINRICAEKRVPRDCFINEYLSYLVEGDGPNGSPLAIAADLIENPRGGYIHIQGESAYKYLAMTDDEVERKREEQEEMINLIEAVARLKGIPFGVAQSSLARYTDKERAQIMDNPKVKKAIENLKQNQDTNKIDLSNFLKP